MFATEQGNYVTGIRVLFTHSLLKMWNKPAVGHQRSNMLWELCTLVLFAGGEVFDGPCSGIHLQRIPVADVRGIGTDEHRQTDIDGVAIENTGKKLGNDRRDATTLDHQGCALPAGARPKIIACHHDVALLYFFDKVGIRSLHGKFDHLLHGQFHGMGWINVVGIDIVTEFVSPTA